MTANLPDTREATSMTLTPCGQDCDRQHTPAEAHNTNAGVIELSIPTSWRTPMPQLAVDDPAEEPTGNAPGDSDSTIHPAVLNGDDVARMKRYGLPENKATVEFYGAIKREAYDAGRADVLEHGDGYHTFDELYHYRMLYHAAFANVSHVLFAELVDGTYQGPTVKSWRHSDGEECFGGGWFIVVSNLGTGQISNHYKAEHWDLFQVPEVDQAPKYDGHTPAEAAARLDTYLRKIVA